VVTTGPQEPQTLQIRESLTKLSSDGVIRVLDFGAGKGRLIANIVDVDEQTKQRLVERRDYIAYDPYSTDKAVCQEAIANAYGTADKRYFNSLDDLLSVCDRETFQVVVMCNVLHEINPKDWLKIFTKGGSISDLISNDGFLLLVEDHQMTIGEKAIKWASWS
jgi:SAM-dependent methyltransferase